VSAWLEGSHCRACSTACMLACTTALLAMPTSVVDMQGFLQAGTVHINITLCKSTVWLTGRHCIMHSITRLPTASTLSCCPASASAPHSSATHPQTPAPLHPKIDITRMRASATYLTAKCSASFAMSIPCALQ
jgi:hypothetical protein